jgi:phosphatidylglycerophosphatase A
MTLTTHATLGAVIGHTVGTPLLAFVFGFISHFLIDMIPHGDTGLADNYKIHKRRRKTALAYVMVDAVIAILFVLLLANTRDLDSLRTFSWGIVGGVLPDLIVGLYEITKTPLLKWFNTLHFAFHDFFVRRKGDVPLYYALLAQVVLIAYLQTKL